MGSRLRRRRLGIPAGPRVRQWALDWPRRLQQIATLALLIGLPVVLVLAWYHGDRGQQRVSTPEFAILTLLLLLGGGAFWYYQRASEAGRCATHGKRGSTGRIARAKGCTPVRRRAALREPQPRREDDAFFVDGIHDDILTQLSKVSALRVISRTSVEQFRDTKLPMKAIADQLGVTKILEGGVQRAGDRVRVNVQLIDAATDAHLWAESYDRELSAANIFAIQSEVAAAIAGALKTTLTAGRAGAGRRDPDAESRGVAGLPARQAAHGEAHQRGSCRRRAVLPRGHRPRSAVRARVRWTGGHSDPADSLQRRTQGIAA